MKTRTRNWSLVLFASLIAFGCEQRASSILDPQQPTTTLAGETITLEAGDNQAGPAQTVLSTQLKVLVKNASGQPVNRMSVTWTTTGGGTLSGASKTTNNKGEAVATWKLGATGVQTVKATITGGANVTFTAKIVSITAASGDNQSGTAFTLLPTPATILVRDFANNPVAGVSGTWTVLSGGGSISESAFTTDASGNASVDWTLGSSGPQQLVATLSGGGTAIFNATLVTIAPSAGNNQTAAPGSTLPVKPTIVVKTAGGTPIAGASGTWSVSSGGGSVSSAAFTTDAGGLASVDWTLGATDVQTLTATLNSGGSTVFNANIASIAVAGGNNQYVGAGATLPVQPTIIVRNGANAPIAGVTGTWVVQSGGGSVSSAAFTTNANGVASVNWTLGTTGTQALAASLNVGGSVTFNAAIVTISIVDGNGQTAPPGSTLPTNPTIVIRDLANVGIPSIGGTWSVTLGGGSVAGINFFTNSQGQASVPWTLGASGAQALQASVPLVGSVTFGATIGTQDPPAGATLARVAGHNQKGVPIDTLPIDPVVLVRDASNSPLAGVSVEWLAPDGGGVKLATTNTDANGEATNRWILGWGVVQQRLRARISAGGTIVNLNFIANIDTALLRFQRAGGNNQTAPAGATLPQRLVVQVTDTLGNPIPGVTGTFAVAGGGSISKTSLTTGENGRDSLSWTLGTSGAQTVTANAGVLGTVNFNATIATGPTPGSQLFIVSGNNQKGTPRDTLAVNPTVELRDASNNVISGASIQWSVEAGSNLGGVRSTTTTTGADGRTSTRWILGWGKHQQTLKAKVAGIDSITFVATVDTARLRLRIVSGNNQVGPVATPLTNKLVVELKDTLGNAFAGVGTFAVTSGGGSLSKSALTTGAVGGRDSVVWTLGTSGTQTVTATIGAFGPPLTFTATLGNTSTPGLCPNSVKTVDLNLALAQTVRFKATDADAPSCLNFNKARDLGKQFLVMFEDMPPIGSSTTGFFRGANNTQVFAFTIGTAPPPSGNMIASSPVAAHQSVNQDEAFHAWDSPTGPIYEIPPALLPAIGPQGNVLTSTQAMVTYNVGDTISVQMTSVPRLSIPSGVQKAVVRKVTTNIVFAEDTRLGTTLVRENGTSRNTPMTDAQMTAIAAEYDAYGHVQNNLLFNNTWNAATVNAGFKIVAVHTVNSTNSMWGYTFPSTNVFMFDYWVGTADGKTATVNQHPQRIADNLFTHEIAHQRHYVLNTNTFTSLGNGINWFEGLARFAERGAVANRLLGVVNPSRTSNLVLPKNPAFGSLTIMSDIPDYTKTASGVFTGYDAYAYFFDYVADQYAAGGGDWRAGIRSMLINGNTEASVNAAINNLFPGQDIYGLTTKSRIALYTDDYPNVTLPGHMQYLQYNLRASRLSSATDPRATFLKINPGATFTRSVTLGPGTAQGYLITGDLATADAAIKITMEPYARGVVSVTRIK